MFSYKWSLKKDYLKNLHNLKVFSTFACGGGSTMGYKLAGYDVIGATDIDPKMAEVYKKNHNPKYYYLEDIRDFNKKDDLPKEFYQLDILDGSPPCSSFSLAGNREKDWGKNKKFREGQSKQVLDDLFFDYIETINKLKPKIFVAENVKGLVSGNAKGYLVEIIKKIKKIGYTAQIFLLNAATMGVPQKRERVFIIGHKEKLNYSKLGFDFKEKILLFKDVRSEKGITKPSKISQYLLKHKINNDKCISDINERLFNKISGFNAMIIKDGIICPTITSSEMNYRDCDNLQMTQEDLKNVGTFPEDYDFLDIRPKYLIGMSVPPVMMAQVSNQIYLQWLKKDNGKN